MTQHRLRLSDRETDIIMAALRARLAMAKGKRALEIRRLLDRFDHMGVGNPHLRWIGDSSLMAPED